jgi:hypothetical protein
MKMTKKPRFFFFVLIVFVIIVGTACNIFSQFSNDLTASATPGASTETVAPFVAEVNGPPGFVASLLSPDIVKLTWKTVPDASGYIVQRVVRSGKNVAIASLPADATSFTDLMSPESSVLTYRLQTIKKDGLAGASSLQILTQPHTAKPLTVQASFTEAAAVTARIGPSGGSLALTDAQHMTYTLSIPPGALDYEIAITMTPIMSIGSWPLDGKHIGGVRLEPEGFQLNEVASLTFDSSNSLNPAMKIMGYAFQGSGDEFHLQPISPTSASIVGMRLNGGHLASPMLQKSSSFSLPIMILSNAGEGQASVGSATDMAMNHAPTSSEATARQKQAVAEINDLVPLPISQVAANGVLEQILNAEDCDEFKLAADSFQHWDINAKKAAANGDYEGYDGLRATMIEQLAEKAVETIEKAGEECKKAPKGNVPGSVPCAEKILKNIESGSSPFFQELQHQIINGTDVNDTGLKARMSNSHANLNKCPHSYRINDAASSGRNWIKQCIPTLDRTFIVSWKSPDGMGEFGFFPDTWESGRARMRVELTAYGVKTKLGGQGTYTVTPLSKDPQGNPIEMTLDILARGASTICSLAAGTCQSVEDSPMTDSVPIIVSNTSCS